MKPTNETDLDPPEIDVTCQGTPREMGRVQGEALRGEILELRERLYDLEAFRLKQPRFMPYWLYLKLAERKSLNHVAKALRDSPEFSERLSGLAEGANLDTGSLSLFQAMEPMLAAVDPESARAAAAACSAVAVRGGRSKTQGPLIARNFDYLPMVQPFYILRRDKPAGGLSSLIFTAAALVGAVDGLNESGLAICYNYAFCEGSGKPAPTISMRIAEALANCRTVSDALSWISDCPRWGTGQLMLADEAGEIAAIELSHRHSQIRRPEADADLLFHSNCYLSREMQSVQVPQSARWSERSPKALRGQPVLQSSNVRDARFWELTKERTAFDLDELANIMSDHGPEGVPSADTICMHSDYWNTTASIQLIPAARTLRVSYSSTCQAEYREFQV